jgi:hypothetical protein
VTDPIDKASLLRFTVIDLLGVLRTALANRNTALMFPIVLTPANADRRRPGAR